VVCAVGEVLCYRAGPASGRAVGFSARDPLTVEIRLKQPTPYFLNLLNHYSWFPVHIPTIEKFDGLGRKGTRWTRPENFVGNGPFVITKWIPNQIVVVEKSATYWDRDRVKLNAIHFYPIESGETEERMFRSGQLHKTQGLPLSKIDVYKRDNPDLLHIDPFLGTMYIRVNVTRPHLSDPRVRQALALAINREHLTTYVNKSGKIPAYNLTPPDTAGFTPEARFEGGLEEARALLTEAGFPNGRDLPRIDVLYPTSENGKVIAEAIQEMWRRELGINVRLVNQEWKVYLDSMNTLDYDLAVSIWIGDYVDPNTFLDMFETDNGNNRTGWSNAEYDRLLRQAAQTADQEERKATIRRQVEATGQAVGGRASKVSTIRSRSWPSMLWTSKPNASSLRSSGSTFMWGGSFVVGRLRCVLVYRLGRLLHLLAGAVCSRFRCRAGCRGVGGVLAVWLGVPLRRGLPRRRGVAVFRGCIRGSQV